MKRRSFLKMTGAACTAAFTQPASATFGGQDDRSDQDEVPLDRGALEARNQNRSTVVSRNGMVSASQPLAAQAGLDILKAGGTAVDAAVCANAVLGVVEPMMCGPGGDLFAIVWSESEKKLVGLNASGRSPYDWSMEEAARLGLSHIPVDSPLSWSVPGCVSGWDALLKRFGKLTFAKVLEAAIEYARGGFPVSPIVARDWSIDPDKDRNLAPTFMPTGEPVRFGDIFKNPELAKFFGTLARGGADVFYQGELAERIVAYSKAHGGRFSMRDLRDHHADWVDPVSTSYRGYEVWELPPNGQGIATLQILNLLEHFDIGALEPNRAEHLHLFLEAKKLAFEDRAVYYADMDFAQVPVEELISKEYARGRVKLIDPRRAAQAVAPGRLQSRSDTTYLTTADQDGNMVSLIQSIYYGWGSRYVPDGLGFCLQNRGQLFSLDPEALNKLEPHKRPFHTIIPAFVTRGDKPVFAFGVMGGDFQPQGQSQVLMNIIDFGMSIQQAGEQPRAAHFESSTPTGHKMVGPGSVGLERHFPESVRTKLAEMGHTIRSSVGAFGGYQGICVEESPRRYFGGSGPTQGRLCPGVLTRMTVLVAKPASTGAGPVGSCCVLDARR